MASNSFYVSLIAGIAGVATVAIAPESKDAAHYDAVATVLATTGATLLGFVLTAVTILAALAQTRLLKNLYRTGHARYLLEEFFASVVFFMLVLVFAILFIVNPHVVDGRFLYLSECYFAAGIGVLIMGGVHFYSVMLALGGNGRSAIE
jgi:uncharacterized membrane protein